MDLIDVLEKIVLELLREIEEIEKCFQK